jgi:DNA-binding response OmpR family regulator
MINADSATGRAPPAARSIPLLQGWADLTSGQVHYRNGSYCHLSRLEAELLRYLARQAGRVVSRDAILTEVWQLDPAKTLTRTIDMHIAHLRDKLGDDPARPRVLFTVHGQGYMLAAERRRR